MGAEPAPTLEPSSQSPYIMDGKTEAPGGRRFSACLAEHKGISGSLSPEPPPNGCRKGLVGECRVWLWARYHCALLGPTCTGYTAGIQCGWGGWRIPGPSYHPSLPHALIEPLL